MTIEISRDFKGIWIPKEIWLDQSLTYFEKLLLSEIHSLNGKDGCFASNEYFCKFFNERERKIQEGISKLKAAGYVYQESFDGRERVLRTNLDRNDKSLFSTSGVRNSAPLGCQNPHLSHKNPYYIERKEEIKDLSCSVPSKISKLNSKKQEVVYEIENIFKQAVLLRKNWTTEEIYDAWKILCDSPSPINDGMKMLEGIINNLRVKNKTNKQTKQSPKKDISDTMPISYEPGVTKPASFWGCSEPKKKEKK